MSIVAAEGAGDDWGEVVDLHEASLRRVIGSRTQHADEVDDILQDTYLRALRAGRHPLRAELSDEGWLRMLARRASVDAYRNRRRRLIPVDHLSLVADPATADATASPGSDEHLDAMATREAVRWAFRRLSPRQQRLLVLRGVDQLTYQQMAALEETTVEALASALNRARERLRANIDDYRKHEARRLPVAALLGLDVVRRVRDRFARAQAVLSPHLFELAGATMAVGMAAVLSAPS
ncbi:MAG TPA: sigma-70 family RNA polymerase sigma factor, partial [Acidimicrobiales bacterium]